MENEFVAVVAPTVTPETHLKALVVKVVEEPAGPCRTCVIGYPYASKPDIVNVVADNVLLVAVAMDKQRPMGGFAGSQTPKVPVPKVYPAGVWSICQRPVTRAPVSALVQVEAVVTPKPLEVVRGTVVDAVIKVPIPASDDVEAVPGT